MSSPFSWFRRKQKVLLAVFGVLIMISFTVGGIITSYQQRHMGSGGGNDVVVSWDGGEVTENELRMMRYGHSLAVRFLDRVVQETFARKGFPKAPGVTRDQSGRIVNPGIPRSSQEEDVVRTVLMAQKAADMGMVVTDDAIFEFLDLLSDDKLRRSDYGRLLQATDDQVSRATLFQQLRTELLAQNLKTIVRLGLVAMLPERAWDYFNRFNREISAEVFPIRVADYTSKVERTPTEAEIEQLYEEAKDRYPDPYSPEPGFKRRKKIAFQYLKIDYNEFLEREKAAVSMEEVEKYYEENKDDFKVLELPPTEDEKPETKPEVTPGEDGGSDVPDAKPGEADASGTQEKPSPDATGEAPDAAKPEAAPKAKPPAESAAAKKKTAEAPAKTEPPTPDIDLVPPKNEPAKPEKPVPPKDARTFGPRDTLFVSLSAEPESKAAASATEAKPKPDKPAEAPGDGGAEKPKSKDDGTSKPSSPPPPEKKGDRDEAAAPIKDAPPSDGETAAKEKPVKYQTLEEAEDEIRTRIASPIAEEKKKKAFEAAERKVALYFDERIQWDAMVRAGQEAKEPPPLDHEALAEQLNITAGETPMVDEIEIVDFELGKSYFFQGGQTITFPQIAYAENIPLFKPYSILSSIRDVEFLYWKIEEEDWKTDDGKDQSVPELEEIRDEVVDAWQRLEAVKLAKAEAKRLAEKSKGKESLKAALDKEQADAVVETGRFTWLTVGAMPMGMGVPRMSLVNGVEAPGTDFMEAVFALKQGDTGVAVNQPQTIVYVVRIVKEFRDEDQRRKEFLESMGRGGMFAMYPHMATVQEIMEDWYKDLEKEMAVKWQRRAQIQTQR